MRSSDADASLEGTAIHDQISPELDHSRPPRATRGRVRGGSAIPPEGRRFSPLTAPEREGVDIFLIEARPWAARQAKRTYRHLPTDLQDQAVDEAMMVIRAGAGHSDRRHLYAELSEALDGSLRRVHVGWCLSQAPALYHGAGTAQPDRGVPTPPGEPITRFIEDGLSGLERAVLQLEIGAGRDSSVVRAALKLGPRQYLRHREAGLAKLRLAIRGQMAGRVCDDHLTAVTLAATGDRSAGDDLATGRERCRSCARESGLMRRVLHERLAMAPWPLAIKPAGILAAKLGGLTAVMTGSKTAGTGTLLTTSAGASGASPVLATILAASVIASGTLAATGTGGADPERAVTTSAPAAMKTTAAKPAGPASKTTAAAFNPATTKSSTRSGSTKGGGRATSGGTTASAAAPTTSQPGSGTSAAPGSTTTTGVQPTVDRVRDTVKQVSNRVKDTTRQVTRKLPRKVAVRGTGVEVGTPDVQAPVDRVVDAASDLLKSP